MSRKKGKYLELNEEIEGMEWAKSSLNEVVGHSHDEGLEWVQRVDNIALREILWREYNMWGLISLE